MIYNPEEHIIIPIKLQLRSLTITIYALIDSGATSSFIDADLVLKHQIPLHELSHPLVLEVVDGRQISSGNITHETTSMQLLIGQHRESIALNVTRLGHYPVILGISWLKLHDPHIVWSKHRVSFSSEYCEMNCLELSTTVFGLPYHPESTSYSQPPSRSNNLESSSNYVENPSSFGLPIHPQSTSFGPSFSSGNTETFSRYIQNSSNSGPTIHHDNTYSSKHSAKPSNLESFTNVLKTHPISELLNHTETIPTPQQIINRSNIIIPKISIKKPNISVVSATSLSRACNKNAIYLLRLSELTIESDTDSMAQYVPSDYHDFADVFSKAEANHLPEHGPYDHGISIEEGKSPPFGPIYKLSEVELKALREYLEENLGKGFITTSTSPAGAPIIFAKKKDGSLRLCVDYRGLNKITIKNRYPLPLISEMLDRVSKATYFTKIDLRGAYNLVRIKSGEEWKTAFRCRYGHFEYRVMPFGLTNAPATFQHFMNDTFRDYLDDFCIIYLDDILIYSTSLEENKRHVKLVLSRLRSAHLFAKPEKCQFHVSEIEFLGYVISPRGISMDPSKVSAITSWPPPKSVHDIQVFIGFANFYRRFISNYSGITSPITYLLKKNVDFIWSNDAHHAFEYLKRKFTTAPILRHFDPSRPSIIETDASDFAIACIISQKDDSNILHPIAFYSRKLTPPEVNYEIYDKEMLAIITAFKQWRAYLEGSQHRITVFTDHRNLEWFTETKVYTRRQARWAELLAGYDFVIMYRPGSKGGKPDALSRRSDYQLADKGDDLTYQTERFLKPHQFIFAASTVSILTNNSELQNSIRNALEDDPFISTNSDYLLNPDFDRPPEVDKLLKHYTMVDGLVFYRGLIYIPKNSIKLSIMKSHHDSPTSGHFGHAKTFELISRDYYWPNMRRYIREYIQSCDVCNRNKTPRHKPAGPLHPLPIPDTPWSSVSFDFIVELPMSSGHNAIFVVVDRFTKMAHFIPTTTTITAEGTADLYLQHVFRIHGFPKDIVSDRGPQFTSKFWSRLMELCDVKQNLSTAYHPQSDGQTERVNQVLEQYLRIYCNYQQDDWHHLLTLAEFTYNNAKHTSTTISPFYANYGYHPRFQLKIVSEKKTPSAETYIDVIKNLHTTMQAELKTSQENYKKYYDRKVMDVPSYSIGQQVWLLRKNISTTRPSSKLDYKRLGPFKIVDIIGDSKLAVKLDLPPSMKIHPVFHVSLLEPYYANTIAGRQQDPPPPVTIQGQEEWVVKEVLDSRIRRNKLEYLVDWDGWSPSDRTWEPASYLENSQKLVTEFHAKYPEKFSQKDIRPRGARS